MEKVYPLLKWLSCEEAVDWLHYITNSRLDTLDLISLCNSGQCDIYVDLHELQVTNSATGMNLELCGEGKVIGGISCGCEMLGAPIFISERFSVECDAYGVLSSEDATSEFIYGKRFFLSGRHYPLFKPADIRTLAKKMDAVANQSFKAELEILRHQLGQEQAARKSAEQRAERVEAEKPLERRERATFERLIYVLAKGANYQLDQPHADEVSIQAAADIREVKGLAGKGTIAKYLKAAAARVEQDKQE